MFPCVTTLLQNMHTIQTLLSTYDHQGINIIEHNVDCAKNKDSRSQNTKHIKQ